MPESFTLTILFFAKARELVNCKESNLTVTSSERTVAQLQLEILAQFPALDAIRDNFILAYNEEYRDDPHEIIRVTSGDEIAIIPPISGG